MKFIRSSKIMAIQVESDSLTNLQLSEVWKVNSEQASSIYCSFIKFYNDYL